MAKKKDKWKKRLREQERAEARSYFKRKLKGSPFGFARGLQDEARAR